MGMFATGVAIIAVDHNDAVHAMTANAVSALSLDPMQVLFCPSKRARLSALLHHSVRFSINFLREDEHTFSTYFAGGWKVGAPPPFRFVSAEGVPRLEGCLASISCSVRQILEGGDHWLVIGEVMAIHHGIGPHRPLLFFKGKYEALSSSASAPAPILDDVRDEPPRVFYHHE